MPPLLFFLVHERLGLCYLRVPTWLPFRLPIYCNGHTWLAHQLRQAGIACRMEDNAFVEIADWKAAQTLADGFSIQATPTWMPWRASMCPASTSSPTASTGA